MTKKIGPIALALLAGACAAPQAWNKPGASVADFNTEKYECMQASQHQVSSAYVNRYGGAASSEQTTNAPLYAACMNAHGWSLQKDYSADAKAQAKDLVDRLNRICTDPKYAAYYSKSACKADQVTFDQLADTSKISPEARAIYPELRNKLDATSREFADLLRRYGGTAGARRASAFDASLIATQQINLALYEGQITWGEYNKRRQEIYRQSLAADKEITS